jgi:hypothetical protein
MTTIPQLQTFIDETTRLVKDRMRRVGSKHVPGSTRLGDLFPPNAR